MTERSSQTHSHNIHLKITGLVRRFLRRRNKSSSDIHCCYIIISTEFKEKHTLEQDNLFCYDHSGSSVAQSCPTLCEPMNYSTPGLPVHHQLLKFTQTHIHRVGDAIQPLILCYPLLLPPIPSSIRVFSNESPLCMRWPKYWSFSFSIIPSKEHPWLVSFRMNWWDLLAVQGTLKSLLQHHSSKASILQRSALRT